MLNKTFVLCCIYTSVNLYGYTREYKWEVSNLKNFWLMPTSLQVEIFLEFFVDIVYNSHILALL